MKCCEITTGMLDRQIVIERKTRTSDGMGGVVDTWDDLDTVYAMIKTLNGYELLQAMRVSPKARLKATIRFRGDSYNAPYYSCEDRVLYKGRYYNVESIVDIDERRMWLQLILIEGEQS